MAYVKGGWMEYIATVKSGASREIPDHEFKDIMSDYLAGKSIEECITDLPAYPPALVANKQKRFT